jgi:hypothetical protein
MSIETNQVLKLKFGCLLGDRVKLSPSDTKWGTGIVNGYIPPCEEDERDYVSIDFEDMESHDHQENLWLVSGEFTLI